MYGVIINMIIHFKPEKAILKLLKTENQIYRYTLLLTGNQCMFFPARKYPAALPLFGRKVDYKNIKFRELSYKNKNKKEDKAKIMFTFNMINWARNYNVSLKLSKT